MLYLRISIDRQKYSNNCIHWFSFNSGTDGAYVDMLLDSSRHSCVVLIDMRRYFKQFRVLAKEVAARGIPLVLITDTDCYWARELTPHVLMIQERKPKQSG